MSKYRWKRHVKDKNNIIIDCIIIEDIENGKEIQVKKDEFKYKMERFRKEYPDKELIKNLTLTRDGKLLVRDNIIDEYIRSCKLLGLEPLRIEKVNDI